MKPETARLGWKANSSSTMAFNNATFWPVTPHFHKAVSHDVLFDNKLKIPEEFMKTYGANISTSNPVLIKVPSGGKWRIHLIKCDGHVWLGKGWPEFARHHSIKCGHSLFFKFDGSSHFLVVILDENGLEIEYPISGSSHFNESNPIMDELFKRGEEALEDEDYDYGEDLNSGSPCLKRKEKSRHPSSRPQRRMKTQCYNEEMTTEEQVNIGDSESSESEEMKGRFKSRVKALGSRKRSLTADEKAKALYRTIDFTSQNPYFKVVIQKSHVHDRYDMALPPEFWREHLFQKFGLVFTLYVPNGRTWLLKLHSRPIYSSKAVRATFVKRNWQEFAVDNNLKVGDVCIFELINKNEILFKVSIDREGEYDQNGQQSQANPVQLKKSPNVETLNPNLHNDETGIMPPMDQTSENEFQHRPDEGETNDKPGNMMFGSTSRHHTSGEVTHDVFSSSRGRGAVDGAARQLNRSFEVELPESFIHSLRIPARFGRTYFEGKPQTAALEVGKKLWLVKLVGGSSGLIFCGGWPAFVRDNHLNQGDHCIFELVSKERDHPVLKVTISRKL